MNALKKTLKLILSRELDDYLVLAIPSLISIAVAMFAWHVIQLGLKLNDSSLVLGASLLLFNTAITLFMIFRSEYKYWKKNG
jgi:predicted neutral ceramidase superfamily lipid hydrolase